MDGLTSRRKQFKQNLKGWIRFCGIGWGEVGVVPEGHD